MRFPSDFVPLMCQALKNTVAREHHAVFKELEEKNIPFLVGFQGSFGAHRVTPRSLKASLLGRLVAVDGILIKLSPRLLAKTKESGSRLKRHSGRDREDETDEGSVSCNSWCMIFSLLSRRTGNFPRCQNGTAARTTGLLTAGSTSTQCLCYVDS